MLSAFNEVIVDDTTIRVTKKDRAGLNIVGNINQESYDSIIQRLNWKRKERSKKWLVKLSEERNIAM